MVGEDLDAAVKAYAKLDHAALAAICRQGVRLMLQSEGCTYAHLATQISAYNVARDRPDLRVNSDALKTFCSRAGNRRYNKNNKTLESLHLFFSKNLHHLDSNVQSYLISDDQWPIIQGRSLATRHADSDRARHSFALVAKAMRSWMNVGDDLMARAISTFPGRYVLLRKSVLRPEDVIKSQLEIRWEDSSGVLTATHTHRDRQNWPRVSEGFVTPIMNSTLCIMLQVEDGRALECINVRVPMQRRFRRLMGFSSSVIFNGDLIGPRVFIERDDEDWAKLGSRFKLDSPMLGEARRKALEMLLDHPDDQPGLARTIPAVAIETDDLEAD